MGAASVVNVMVECSDLPVPQLRADAGVRSAVLSWETPPGAVSANLYVSSSPNCDIDNYANCPDGELRIGAVSPLAIENLRNEQAYFFALETIYDNGARGLSNEASTRPNALSFDGDVKAIGSSPDGTVYLGGSFGSVAVTTGSAVPLDRAAGRLAHANFPIVAGKVFATVPDGNGGWYIGGEFTRVGDATRTNLAHVLQDGTVDPAFAPDPNRPVDALAILGDILYVGGYFTQLASAQGPRIRVALAAIHADGTIDDFNPVLNGAVRALAVGHGRLYVGGSFSAVDADTQHGFLAAFRALDSAVQPGALLDWSPGVQGPVLALATSAETVYAGGIFTAPRQRLAAIDSVTALAKVNYPQPQAGAVAALAASGEVLYVGGAALQLADAGGGVHDGLAAIHTASQVSVVAEQFPDVDGEVDALVVQDGTLYVGGMFRAIGDVSRNSLGAVGANGVVIETFKPEPNGEVAALATADSTLYVGGSFTGLGGTPRNGLAALDAQGRLLSWNPDTSGTMRALVVSGSIVYVGGDFTTPDGVIHPYLAAIGADGAVDQAFEWGAGVPGSVHALGVSQDGTVYAGGDFAAHLLAFHAGEAGLASSAPIPWDPAIDAPVRAILVRGNTLYVGGDFQSVAGTQHPGLAQFSLSAANRPVLAASAIADGGVYAIAASEFGAYAGGRFAHLSEGDATQFKPRSHLGEIGIPLREWTAQPADRVNALALSGDTLYAGGRFRSIAGAERNFIAAIHVDQATDRNGTLEEGFHADADDEVFAIAVAGDSIYVGGVFRAIDGKARGGYAVLDRDGTVR